MLFPASLKNDTEQIFITCRELNNVKESIINSKIHGLLGIIDLKKLIHGTKLKDNLCGLMLCWKSKEKEILADTFAFRQTLTLNDFLKFSINLIDDNNKEIEFASNKKKFIILNFKIDVFLKRTKDLDH